jgi:hypothetical protein
MDMKLVEETIGHLRAERKRVEQLIANLYTEILAHIDDHDLERYHLSKVAAGEQQHLLWCVVCVDRAEAAARYVDAMRAALSRRSSPA